LAAIGESTAVVAASFRRGTLFNSAMETLIGNATDDGAEISEDTSLSLRDSALDGDDLTDDDLAGASVCRFGLADIAFSLAALDTDVRLVLLDRVTRLG